MSTGELLERIVTQGLLPRLHNVTFWQHADHSGWGVSIQTADPFLNAEAHGDTLQSAMEEMMRKLNRGADLPPKAVEANDKRASSP